MSAYLWAGKGQEEEFILLSWLDIYLACHPCYTSIMSVLTLVSAQKFQSPKTSKNLNALYSKSELTFLEFVRVRETQCGSSPLSSPSLSSKLHMLSEALQGWREQWEGCWSKCECCKGTRDFLCADREGHEEHGLQVVVILELKTHILCYLRAFWLLNECKTSFMWNSVEAQLRKLCRNTAVLFICVIVWIIVLKVEKGIRSTGLFVNGERNIQEKFENSGLRGEGCYHSLLW